MREVKRDSHSELFDKNLGPQGQKLDQGKLRWDLLPFVGLEEVVKVLTFGTIKYSAWNWYRGLSYSKCVSAMFRHFKSWWWDQEDYDAESKCHHLAAVSFYALVMLTFTLEKRTDIDDRIKKYVSNKQQTQ